MRLYLDEDVGSHYLVQALRKAGHDVITPVETGQLGRSDILQFSHAVETERVMVTGNHRDFEDIHDLVLLCRGQHPGMLTIRKDNDSRRDMKPGQIVASLHNVESVLASIRDRLICLNDWR